MPELSRGSDDALSTDALACGGLKSKFIRHNRIVVLCLIVIILFTLLTERTQQKAVERHLFIHCTEIIASQPVLQPKFSVQRTADSVESTR